MTQKGLFLLGCAEWTKSFRLLGCAGWTKSFRLLGCAGWTKSFSLRCCAGWRQKLFLAPDAFQHWCQFGSRCFSALVPILAPGAFRHRYPSLAPDAFQHRCQFRLQVLFSTGALPWLQMLFSTGTNFVTGTFPAVLSTEYFPNHFFTVLFHCTGHSVLFLTTWWISGTFSNCTGYSVLFPTTFNFFTVLFHCTGHSVLFLTTWWISGTFSNCTGYSVLFPTSLAVPSHIDWFLPCWAVLSRT
jgi:hypothetical protein